jgi:hypothetical protein
MFVCYAWTDDLAGTLTETTLVHHCKYSRYNEVLQYYIEAIYPGVIIVV